MANAFNIATGAEAASDATVWSTTTGGSNDRGVPTTADVAIYDVNSTGSGVWDIALVGSLDLQAAYAGSLPLSVNVVTSTAGVQVNDGTLARGTFDITCETDFIVGAAGTLTGTTGTIVVGDGGTGDITIDTAATASAAFTGSTVDIRGTGTVETPNLDNQFWNCSACATGMTSTMVGFVRIAENTLSLGGGNFVNSSSGIDLRGPVSPLVFTGDTTFSGGDDLSFTSVTTPSIPGHDYGDVGLTFNFTGTFNITGEITTTGNINARGSAGVPAIANTNGFNMSVNRFRVGSNVDSDAAGVLNCGSSVITCTEDLQVYGTLSEFNADTSVWSIAVDCELNEGTFNGDSAAITVLGDLRVADVMTVVGGSAVISVDTDILIDLASTCDWGTSTVIHTGTGDIENETQDNAFYSLTVAASGEVTTMIEEVSVVDGTLSFGGGTYVAAHRTTIISDGAQMIGAGSTTFSGTGKIRLLATADMTIPAMNLSTVALDPQGSGTGAREITTLGNITCGTSFVASAVTNLITLSLGGDYNMGFLTHGFIGSNLSAIINLNGFTLTNSSYRYDGAANQIIGPGIIVCGGGLDVRLGTFEMSGITASFVQDLDVDLGAIFDLGTGNITIDRDTVPLGAIDFGCGVFAINAILDLSSASSVTYGTDATIKFIGSNTQTPDFGAVVGKNITVQKTGGDVAPTTKVDITGRFRTAAVGNSFFTFLVAVTNAVGEFQTVGTGAFETSIRSSSAATKADIVVGTSGHVQRHSGWKDTNVTGAIVNVDTLTGSDDGNNTVAGAEGLLFAEHPIVPSTGKGLGLGQGLGFKLRN